ncbi:SGNH/GDSL hydrolase family protein [Adhaeretor mobilis]|uniref:Hydrolase n=1 Tax=Adhaeretor mobilis TaxID=1930276 RepID=A0A517MZQ5_9BACT|nr:SGNH/GDSL hydrolase family protein [Adhaeretor mobilis]QDT00367.1 hypothetical protein HG15A2_37030 [Adhaeretor mobilis]
MLSGSLRYFLLICLCLLLARPIVAVEVARSGVSKPTVAGSSRVENGKTEERLSWHDLRSLDIEGKGWGETSNFYDRLPAKAEGLVRPEVWSLSHHTAGMCVRFITDAREIHARWTLYSPNLAMPHMAATGVSGLDLYVKADQGNWRWLAVGKPVGRTNELPLAQGLPAGKREYLLYLPLYNGITSLELGVPHETLFQAAPKRPAGRDKPLVFYGTSIAQGCAASRPGMVHTALLGRQLDVPVINLGFSGNGKMELELAELLSELDPAVFVLDCLPNINSEVITERTEPFVKKLREKHPHTPILLVEDRTYADAFLNLAHRKRHRTSRQAYHGAFQRLQEAGVVELYYLKGDQLLGDDGEGTVDGSHPNDLGFMRQASEFRKVLEPLLGQ